MSKACRHCGMREGEPYNGSPNCMWYGEHAYSDERKRDLGNQGCFKFAGWAGDSQPLDPEWARR